MTKRHFTVSSSKAKKRPTKQARCADTLNHSLGPEQPGLLIAHYGATLIVENSSHQLFRCYSRQNIGPLVTGDEVIWQQTDEQNGIIIGCAPRRTVIIRPDHRANTKPMAANVDQMIIVAAWEPLPQQTTIDRYLILAESLGLKALIIMNKSDLAHEIAGTEFLAYLKIYQALNYPWLEVSSKTGLGINELLQYLKGQTSILVGQSGVGKTSLLSCLLPDVKVQIRALSQGGKQGRHTTTASYLYHLPLGGNIIDSPGIHRFKLHHLNSELITQGYKEFRPFLGQCKFRNCAHEHEPGCAILTAVNNGSIHSLRFQNYRTLIKELAD